MHVVREWVKEGDTGPPREVAEDAYQPPTSAAFVSADDWAAMTPETRERTTLLVDEPVAFLNRYISLDEQRPSKWSR
jgi:hypothetical protein